MKGALLEIPKEFKKYDSSWFYNLIISHNSTYIIDDKELSSLIDVIDREDLKSVLYLIYKIIIEDSLKPKVSKIPNNGIELFNPINGDLYGIYHIHLNNNILIWYLKWSKNGLKLNFEYRKHPFSSNYNPIISEIYKRDDDGYNINKEDYFTNLYNILNFNIDVLKFNEFKKQ
jgi:hypothetical protein